jgi:hypothetical protein
MAVFEVECSRLAQPISCDILISSVMGYGGVHHVPDNHSHGPDIRFVIMPKGAQGV